MFQGFISFFGFKVEIWGIGFLILAGTLNSLKIFTEMGCIILPKIQNELTVLGGHSLWQGLAGEETVEERCDVKGVWLRKRGSARRKQEN